nr:MAG TPA: hypothetical protein [Caudoviricetes sp.]
MRDSEFLDKALKWIDAVESGKSGYYVDDIQTVSDGYTFQIIHGSKSMRFFVYAKSISVFLHEIKYDCCCTTQVLFNQELLNYANQEKVWNFAVNLYERKMSNSLNEEMEWNITVMLWGCFVTVLLGAVGIVYVLWKG